MNHELRHIHCPRCGADIRIPWFWVIGIEGIFRCRTCRQPFKTGYKMGAFLSALGLCLSMAVVQVMVYLLSIYSMPVFVLLMVPMWIFFAFLMRKTWMLHRVRQAVRRTSRETTTGTSENTSEVSFPVQTPEDEYFSLQKLPDDTPFETEGPNDSDASEEEEESEEDKRPVIKNPFTGETF